MGLNFHLPNIGAMIDGAVRPIRDQLNNIPNQINGAVNHVRDQLQNSIDHVRDQAKADVDKVTNDLHDGLNNLENRLSKGFHTLEDAAKTTALRVATHDTLNKLHDYEADVVPRTFGINLGFVDLSITGLADKDDDGKTGLDRLIVHLAASADSVSWSRSEVKNYLLGFAACGVTLTLTVLASASIPIIGEVGAQASWDSDQLADAIEHVLNDVGL